MVEQMARAVMNPVNKKVAFLTFKIVEETVKRVCLKNEIDKLMPVLPECINSIKKSLNIQTVTTDKLKSALIGNLKNDFMSLAIPSLRDSDITPI